MLINDTASYKNTSNYKIGSLLVQMKAYKSEIGLTAPMVTIEMGD